MSDRFNTSMYGPADWMDAVDARARSLGMTKSAFFKHCVVKEMDRLEKLHVRRLEAENEARNSRESVRKP